MRQRCLNPNHPYFSKYGGRGISICPSWNSFREFAKDMGTRPLGTSLDRIDNGLPYGKSNCRWATRIEQNRNTGQNRLVAFGGNQRCLSEWCELFDLSYARVYARLFKLQWTPAHAFFRV